MKVLKKIVQSVTANLLLMKRILAIWESRGGAGLADGSSRTKNFRLLILFFVPFA